MAMFTRLFPSLASSAQLLRPRTATFSLSPLRRPWNHTSLTSRSRPGALGRPRFASYGPRRSRPQYQYFGRAQNMFTYWRAMFQTSPMTRQVLYFTGGGAVCFVGYNIERVPVTGRLRFNWVPVSFDEDMARQAYNQTLAELRGKLLPEWSPDVQRVKRVLERLVPHSGLADASQPWTVHVVDADIPNAFVLPGRHVFVFRGILPLTGSDNDDGLATVLGHEIAHNVARHSAENLSRNSIFMLGALALSAVFDVSQQIAMWTLDLAYNKPGSRKQESEADYIGLMMMAEACYDPRAAIAFWGRMEQANKGKTPPQFLSTHPSDHNRAKRINGWMNQALEKREASSCGATGGWVDDFQSMAGMVSFR